jgi:exonuclease III
MAKVLTLNTRSIKGEVKQTHVAIYAKRQRAYILLLQETNLSDTAVLPGLTLNNIIQNPAIQVGLETAVATHAELQQQHILIHLHHTLVPGYLQTCHITLYHTEIQLINIYIPINLMRATTVANALKKHIETIPLDRKILIGGDWNVTLEARDRENHTEKRTLLAQELENLTHTHKMIDVWKRFHPDSNQFTYRGNQTTKPKSRMDRIYISENWLHQRHSAQICPWFSLNIPPPIKNNHQPLYQLSQANLRRR